MSTNNENKIGVAKINEMMAAIRKKFNVEVTATPFSDVYSISVSGDFDWFNILEFMHTFSEKFTYSMTKGNRTTYEIEKEFTFV